MGQFVNSTGFRLSYHKNWLGSVRSSFCLLKFFDHYFDNYLGVFPVYSHLNFVYGAFDTCFKTVFFFYDYLQQCWLSYFLKKFRTKGGVNADIYEKYYLLWLRKVLVRYYCGVFNSLFFFSPFQNIEVFFFDRPVFSAPLFSKFLLSGLKEGYSGKRLAGSYFLRTFWFYNKRGVLGFYFSGKGRFTRSQRASAFRYFRGGVPFASVKVPVLYSIQSVVLKYGVCSVRLWVSYSVLFSMV
jgi:hypothetical protein